MDNMTIFKVESCSDLVLDSVKSLYFASFPEDERRPWESIMQMVSDGFPYFSLYAALGIDGTFLGFISVWSLPNDVVYVEHFAVDARFRGRGIGSDIFSVVTDGAANVVLEVELPGDNAMAERRIDFYKHLGLNPLEDFPYYQPPYREDLQPVPMMLMTKAPIEDLNFFVLMFHTLVYNQ